MAVKVAESNDDYPKWPLGAVIFKGGSMLSMGRSKKRTDPRLCDFDDPRARQIVSLHAEVHALQLCGNPAGAVMAVARIGRNNGEIGLAEPCHRCKRAIKAAKIKKVIYTVDPHTYAVWIP